MSAGCARFVRLCTTGAQIILELRMIPRYLAALVHGMFCPPIVMWRVISLTVKSNRLSFVRVYCEFPFFEVIYYSVNMIL